MHVQHLAEGLGVLKVMRQRTMPYTPQQEFDAPYVAPAPAPTIYDAGGVTAPVPLVKTAIPYQPLEKRTILTTEQLETMRDRAIAADQELEARQYSNNGDGVAEDLEREANEANATEKAVAEGADIIAAPAKADNTGLLALAALAYFLFF